MQGCFEPAYTDLPYLPGGDPRQVLDIVLPERGDAPFPTLFLIHGGGFIAGSKSEMTGVAGYFVERGYAVVLAEYRLAPEYTYPAQVQDIFCALAWTHAHAETYSLDPRRMVAVGESAGGTLAALLGSVDEAGEYMAGCPYAMPERGRVQAVVAYYPVVDLAAQDYESFFVPYMGSDPDQAPQDWAKASPLGWIDGGEPPFLLIHGLWDVRVPPNESKKLAAALEAAGAEVELLLLPHTDHRFLLDTPDSPATQHSLEAVLAFLERLFP